MSDSSQVISFQVCDNVQLNHTIREPSRELKQKLINASVKSKSLLKGLIERDDLRAIFSEYFRLENGDLFSVLDFVEALENSSISHNIDISTSTASEIVSFITRDVATSDKEFIRKNGLLPNPFELVDRGNGLYSIKNKLIRCNYTGIFTRDQLPEAYYNIINGEHPYQTAPLKVSEGHHVCPDSFWDEALTAIKKNAECISVQNLMNRTFKSMGDESLADDFIRIIEESTPQAVYSLSEAMTKKGYRDQLNNSESNRFWSDSLNSLCLFVVEVIKIADSASAKYSPDCDCIMNNMKSKKLYGDSDDEKIKKSLVNLVLSSVDIKSNRELCCDPSVLKRVGSVVDFFDGLFKVFLLSQSFIIYEKWLEKDADPVGRGCGFWNDAEIRGSLA